jgi:glycosyltransferase involved in cell wall biosynthesis
LAKCRQLAELEMELGVRSSFNFIPEGSYTVPAELREWLTTNGFEVGVHDLQHDGKLFANRRGFKSKATRINRYLREWKADGFRSGFMLRNLAWMHGLDIHYDSSTFDTDPFELQSNDVDSIFPFWVPAPPALSDFLSANPFLHSSNPANASSRGGYVELPYTLPQDSTLFLVLREATAEIWMQKLDWIAARGGMALVNVHPDYMDFSNSANRKRTYPAALYADLLRHCCQQYPTAMWNPLPRQLANWYKNLSPKKANMIPSEFDVEAARFDASGLRGKRVAVLLYSTYPSDPRPRREAEALAQQGMEVEVICLKENDTDAVEEFVGGVSVRRLPLKHRRAGKLAYIWQYTYFLTATFLILGRRSLTRHYSLVHVHNMPDVLVFSALIPKLRGAKVILDLHDPMPELMMTIFRSHPKSTGTRLLKFFEKSSLRFADSVLTVNEACKKIFSARSCAAEKIHVVMNSPDEGIFKFKEHIEQPTFPRPLDKPFVIMYHGSLVERHGLDLAVNALGKVRQSIPCAELRIYGQRTPYLEKVLGLVKASDLNNAVHYYGAKNLEQIVEAIGACDVGVIPNRRSIFTELNTPTRIFEYLSQARPVIAPRAAGILDYFGTDDLLYFELGDADDLATKIEYVFREPAAVSTILKRGQGIYLNQRWTCERRRFLSRISDVLGVQPPENSTEFVADSAEHGNAR